MFETAEARFDAVDARADPVFELRKGAGHDRCEGDDCGGGGGDDAAEGGCEQSKAARLRRGAGRRSARGERCERCERGERVLGRECGERLGSCPNRGAANQDEAVYNSVRLGGPEAVGRRRCWWWWWWWLKAEGCLTGECVTGVGERVYGVVDEEE